MKSRDEREIINEQYRKLSMMIVVPHTVGIIEELEELTCLISGADSIEAKMIHKKWKELLDAARKVK